MEDEIKIVELEFEDITLKPSDLRMGGVIETKDGTKYMVLIIGARFEFNDKGEPLLLPEQYCTVVGEHIDGVDEEHPVYGTFYNLKLAPMTEEEENGFPLFSEKADRFAANHSEIPTTVSGRTYLQNLLFRYHRHEDCMEGEAIIYHEKDLVKVCDEMDIWYDEQVAKTDDVGLQQYLHGQRELLWSMKQFFEHKA